MRCGMNGSWLPSFRYSGKRGFDDASGNTIVEFAFVGPVLVLLLMGTLDVGHTLYMQAVLQGVMQKAARDSRSEEHTSELQSLMRISYAVFCLKKTNINNQNK